MNEPYEAYFYNKDSENFWGVLYYYLLIVIF